MINDKCVIYFKVSTLWDSVNFCRTLFESDSGLHLLLRLYISSETVMDFTCKYLQNIIPGRGN